MHDSSKTVRNLKRKNWDKQAIFGSISWIGSVSLAFCKVISTVFWFRFVLISEETTKQWRSLHRSSCQAEQVAALSLMLWSQNQRAGCCLGAHAKDGAAPGLANSGRRKDIKGSTHLWDRVLAMSEMLQPSQRSFGLNTSKVKKQLFPLKALKGQTPKLSRDT